MDFAKKILNKYGWKEGDGLGKNNDGIAKPLRANLKFDNAGLGSDLASDDFNNHWWVRVFNEAANNVDIKTKSDGVSMELKNSNETLEITTKGYSVEKLKSSCNEKGRGYDNFFQSGILSKPADYVENLKKITADEINVKKFHQLTDEELFKACGGRTAHKGARHGLKLSGKLNRLELQEKEMLAKMLAKIKQKEIDTKVDVEKTASQQNKLKKKKSKKQTDDSIHDEGTEMELNKPQSEINNTNNELLNSIKDAREHKLKLRRKRSRLELLEKETLAEMLVKQKEEVKEDVEVEASQNKRKNKKNKRKPYNAIECKEPQSDISNTKDELINSVYEVGEHELKLSGKRSRLQEKETLAEMLAKQNGVEPKEDAEAKDPQNKRKNKKKKKKRKLSDHSMQDNRM